MPPKKFKRQEKSKAQLLRREFQNRRRAAPVTIQTVPIEEEEYEFPEDVLYVSRYAEPINMKPKKKVAKKITFPSPHVSDDEVRVSSDEEGAGQCKLPERTTEDEEMLKVMNRMHDSLDDVSLVLLTHNNVRMKTDAKGMLIGEHEKQLEEKWKPAVEEERPGNYPKMNKAHKKVEYKKKQKLEKPPQPIVRAREGQGDWRQTIREENERDAQRTTLRNEMLSRCGRVFGTTPARLNLHKSILNLPITERLPVFSYTPVRGNQLSSLNKSIKSSTVLSFSPKMQSTPIEKLLKGRLPGKQPVFDISYVCDDAEEEIERRLTETAKIQPDSVVERTALARESVETAIEKSFTLKDVSEKEASTIAGDNGEGSNEKDDHDTCHESQKSEEKMPTESQVYSDTVGSITETIPNTTEEDHADVNTTAIPETSSLRKAETSMTDMLADSEEELKLPDDTSYSKKRQRTKSPETMCQDTSAITTMAIGEEEEKENETAGRRRGTLQPQTQQLLRESRLSTMTTASSRRESINSLMEDMSIAVLDDDSQLDLMKSYTSEGTMRLESRNCGTAMTIRNDNPDAPPYYLDGISFSAEHSDMGKLLFVAGQKEPKTWTSLPKGAFDGRTVKKLGEGSYGEVYSTKWNGIPVAIKVVAFEEDEENRKYFGDYHSEKMPLANEIIPELLIMKELSSLKDLSLDDSTPNFINLISSEVVKGAYPKGLLKAWNTYDDQKGSENTRPEDYATKEQLFMLFVTENGGVALESFRLENEDELRSIILQLALSLEAAENALSFEHRDLHLGNVLIDRNGVDTLSYKIRGHDVKIKAQGVKVNIIDFTLSYIYKSYAAIFSNLAEDPDLFTGEGDPQFDVYRKMRDHCGNEWGKHHKKSNLMWIEYLANQLIDNPEICPLKMTAKRKEELRKLFRQLGEFQHCGESFTDESFFNQLYKDFMA